MYKNIYHVITHLQLYKIQKYFNQVLENLNGKAVWLHLINAKSFASILSAVTEEMFCSTYQVMLWFTENNAGLSEISCENRRGLSIAKPQRGL